MVISIVPKSSLGAELSSLALRVLEKRYLKRDFSGRVCETPDAMFRRVASAVAYSEQKNYKAGDTESLSEDFYRMLSRLEFLPNSPALLNAGLPSGLLSSCFALPIDDSTESIAEALKATAYIHKSGGSTGFNLSSIRPAHDWVGARSGVAGGPVALIDLLSATADYFRQGGIRRGCNTAILSIDHPDILDFIAAKADPLKLSNFYDSVAVSDDFMEKAKSSSTYPLINPRNGQVTAVLSAREVFERIVDQAWHTGDPGLVFIDRINRSNPVPHLGDLAHVSGCGEEALLPYESCILGSINLLAMLKRQADGAYAIDWERLGEVIPLAVRFLDDAIDASAYPLPESQAVTRQTRKIGLGVMGFADMLIRLGIPYNSDEAVALAESIMSFVHNHAHEASFYLAEERGCFPAYRGSLYDSLGFPQRNATLTAIAPTGTLSLIAGVSSGIEPIFASVFVRHILDGENILEVNPIFEEVAKEQGFYTLDLLERLVRRNHLHEMPEIPDAVKRVFVTAHRVSPEWHVKIQSAFQRHTDNAVSKTVNFPHEATRDDIARVFTMAYQEGLKGITVYRDGSRELQPLCTSEDGVRLVEERFR